MTEKINRRQFLKLLATITAAGGGALLAKLQNNKVIRTAAYPLEDDTTYLPFVISDKEKTTPEPTSVPPPTGSRVVHAHDPNASNWTRSTPDYWNYVNQDRVNNMVDQGLMSMTGTTTITDAWLSLVPNYKNGERVAIKVSFNNINSCGDSDGQIDSIIHPINAIIRGLKQIGVAESDICVYDSSRMMPSRFVNGCLFPNILFVDAGCQTVEGFSSNDPSAKIVYSVPSGVPEPPDNQVTDTLVKATYLINVPIMKSHGYSGVTLAFKNHFGSIKDPKFLHVYIDEARADTYYDPSYNPLVDVYKNPHIHGKTILTVGDGIFGNWKDNIRPPEPWRTFGNQFPNSLFFSTDPVAFDCVLTDFLDEELSVRDWTNDYLMLASNSGLGVFERGDPWGDGYDLIDYIRINL